MTPMLILLALVALLATVLACVWLRTPERIPQIRYSRQKGFKRHWRRVARLPHGLPRLLNFVPGRSLRVEFANVAEGTHEGSITKKVDAAITTRYLLAKEGTDDDHVDKCGAADLPIGVMTDEAKAAEDHTAIELLGISKRTLLMVASEAIDAGEEVYTAANGKIQDEPATAGTYYLVGIARTDAGADGDLVEVQHCKPVKVVVIAALGNTNGEISGVTITAASALTVGADIGAFTDPPSAAEMATLRTFVNALKADVTALKSLADTRKTEVESLITKAEELADDVRAFGTAQATPAVVKVLSA